MLCAYMREDTVTPSHSSRQDCTAPRGLALSSIISPMSKCWTNKAWVCYIHTFTNPVRYLYLYSIIQWTRITVCLSLSLSLFFLFEFVKSCLMSQRSLTSEQRPPLYKDHFWLHLRVVVVHKFYCIHLWLVLQLVSNKIWFWRVVFQSFTHT